MDLLSAQPTIHLNMQCTPYSTLRKMQIQADSIYIVKDMGQNFSSHRSSWTCNSQGAGHKDMFMWVQEPLAAHITLSKILMAFVFTNV